MPPSPGHPVESVAPVPLDALVARLGTAECGDDGARAAAIEHLDRWLSRGYEPPSSAFEEARLIAAARWMLNYRADHPVIPVWAARATRVLAELDDQRLAALLASFAFEHSIRVGDFGEAGRLVAEMRERTAKSRNAHLTWLPSAALYLWLSGRPDAALAALTPAMEDPGLEPALRHALFEQAASAALAKGDGRLCERYLDATAGWEEALSVHDKAHRWFLRAGAAAAVDEIDAACAAMERCEDLARAVPPGFFVALWRLGGATLRLKLDQARRAERDLTELLGDVVLMRARYLEWSVRLARAAARSALQRVAAGHADLGAALRIAAENGYVNADPWGLTPALRALLQRAVERGIEARPARAVLAHAGTW